MIRVSRLAVPVLATVLALPLVAGAARLPHLKLKRAFPTPDTTLTSSPDAVRLWLSEPADLPATKVSVTDAAGAPVGVAKLTRGVQREDPVVASFVAPPKDGKYSVTWKAMSKDGHVVDGKFAFTVKLAK